MLNPIMHHLHIMARSPLPHHTYTRPPLAILRRHALQQRKHLFDRTLVASRAHRGASARGLVPAAYAAPDVPEVRFFAFFLPPLGVCEVLVAAVEDDVLGGEVWGEGGEDGVADGAVGEGEDEEAGGGEGGGEGGVVWRNMLVSGSNGEVWEGDVDVPLYFLILLWYPAFSAFSITESIISSEGSWRETLSPFSANRRAMPPPMLPQPIMAIWVEVRF